MPREVPTWEGALGGERVERRLAAILAGYSRLMGQDEAGTLARLKTLRRELIDPEIAEHKGRIVKTTGDGLQMICANASSTTHLERTLHLRARSLRVSNPATVQ